jgi:hypothetical protein
MKKTILLFVLVASVFLGCLLWFGNEEGGFGHTELLPIVVVIIVVGLALFIGFRRLSSLHRGEPAEDELSKKILVKSSSVSYYVSLYFWLAVMYFGDKISMEGQSLVGTGILGMAVIFVLTWLYFNFRGLGND